MCSLAKNVQFLSNLKRSLTWPKNSPKVASLLQSVKRCPGLMDYLFMAPGSTVSSSNTPWKYCCLQGLTNRCVVSKQRKNHFMFWAVVLFVPFQSFAIIPCNRYNKDVPHQYHIFQLFPHIFYLLGFTIWAV